MRGVIWMFFILAVPHPLAVESISLPPTPRISIMIDTITAVQPEFAYDGLIREAAALYWLDASLLRSMIAAESRFDPAAVSPGGAMGLMQLMPGIAAALGVEHPFDPRENILAGARLLRDLLDRHRGDVSLALASYNAGPAAVAAWGGVPPFPETRAYVRRVTALVADARRLAND